MRNAFFKRAFETTLVASVAACGLFTVSASAQQPGQKISGPQARYWVNAETSSGIAAMGAGGGGFGSAMGALFGGSGGGPSKSLTLELAAVRTGSPAAGQHGIPPTLNMGASLPLVGPDRPTEKPNEERDIPELRDVDGNMRMMFFWGCGETVGAGQPVVLDTKDIRAGQLPPNMRSTWVKDNSRGPGFGSGRGVADWPNSKDSTRVPASASLTGEHNVASNISPDIRFSVPAENDYLGGVTLNASASPGGGSALSWNAVDRSLGYFATAMGMRETSPKNSDMVVWNSSSQRMLGGQNLMGFLPPAEVARLVGERVVMAPTTTNCTIPKAVLDAAGGQMFMNSLNAFGPELNVVQPPRPQDPRVEWKQDYSVKVRTRSHTSTFNAMAAAGGSRSAGGPPAAESVDQTDKPAGGLIPNLGGVGNVLRGLFGR